jgi:hypothetical protein
MGDSTNAAFRDRNDGGKEQLRKRARRRIRLLWIGLATYFFIFLNAVWLAHRVPYQIFVLGALLNIAIVAGIALELRRAYKELNQ